MMDLEKPPKDGFIFIDIVAGSEGDCLCIGDENGSERIAGPKPWGGGQVKKRFEVSVERLRGALPRMHPQAELCP